ncbi:unnamed protein product [Arctia plantaginis]|uniref:Integrase zinc-binding domain-containing protein n=1 Tax=Arctia plantaginis TaxID=874455 RepID=A0A8S1AXJ4_ARCPL|nr:unnamed protein product [Arctia plantaginis]
MQRIWQSGILWDECIKDPEATIWFQWLNQLKALSNVVVPRWYGLQRTAVDIHVFGDASEKAYAAVAFLVGTDIEGNRVPWPSYKREEFPADDTERFERVLVVGDNPQPLIDVKRYSTWTRALRVFARVLTFITACRTKQRIAVSTLTINNIQEAERMLLKQSQARSFPEELSTLRVGLPLPKSSRLLKLDPAVYDDELLRVRGRLGASTELSFDEKHPVILDGSCPITRLLVQHYHERAMHANYETVVNNIRERFWVTCIRPTVKAVVARCQHCRVQRAQPNPPKMGDLPLVRLTTTRRAFVNCGIDYFGPMEITIGRRREKRWGVLFTCLTTRAVHLELAASLSSDSAILALRRLIARRGQPAIILSDCGTNFVGANKELRAALRGLNAERLRVDRHMFKWQNYFTRA